MKISIAMATYNGAKYLQEQLDSFVAQTRQPDELVVCDDVSSDTTVDILESFRQQAPFAVRIYRNETNLGFVKNFEKALSLCTGDIIFLSDQDDVWFDEKICTVEQIFVEKPNKMVVINDQIITDENLNSTQYTKLGNTLSAGFEKSWFVTGCCTSIRKPWMNFVLPFPDDISHDVWINRLATELGIRVVYDEPLQYYRRHNSNASNAETSSIHYFIYFYIIISYGFKDARDGWKREVNQLREYIKRLKTINAIIDNLKSADNHQLKEVAESSIIRLEKKLFSLEKRIKIVSKPRLFRMLNVIGFYFRGGYINFAGWKSAVKDLLRP